MAFVPDAYLEKWIALLDRTAASDLHIEPHEKQLQVRYRLDGVLQPVESLPAEYAPNIAARLKVLANLLTYETSVPQEGRFRDAKAGCEIRVSTFPTIFGEKCVLRVLGRSGVELQRIDQLGLPRAIEGPLRQALGETSGAILIAGPAGSGKTTTACACLREIVASSSGGRSIASLEDPVETVIDGVSQTQVNAAGGFDIASALRFLLRQDPEVIFVGEIRDQSSAATALQAALTGQLVLTTFHAGNCREAIRRLIECGVPAYAVNNAVRVVVAQRLVRRLCSCAAEGDPAHDAAPLGFQVKRCWTAKGCESCLGTGYRDRAVLAELVSLDSAEARESLLPLGPQSEPSQFETRTAAEPLWKHAETLIEQGVSSPREIVRVLGFRTSQSQSSS